MVAEAGKGFKRSRLLQENVLENFSASILNGNFLPIRFFSYASVFNSVRIRLKFPAQRKNFPAQETGELFLLEFCGVQHFFTIQSWGNKVCF